MLFPSISIAILSKSTSIPKSTPNGSIISISDRQKRHVAVVKEYNDGKTIGHKVSIRQLCQKHSVPHTSLQKATKRGMMEIAELEAFNGRGRQKRLSDDEKRMIIDYAIKSQNNWSTINRNAVRDLTKTFVSTFPIEREKIRFCDNRPGSIWTKSFIEQNPHLALRRRVNL